MSDETEIVWCDSTFNPWIGCTKISPACDNCYAEADSHRRGWAEWGAGKPRKRTSPGNWKKPLQWERAAAEFLREHGRRRRVFCASLADVFDNEIDPAWRAELFDLIAQTPSLDWLLLTKRIGNVEKMLRAMGMAELPRNAWLGATVCNQEEADRDIPKLMKVGAGVRFLSIEPMLGPINLRRLRPDGINFTVDALTGQGEHILGMRAVIGKIHWIIAGGESGAKARAPSPYWFYNLRDQCADAGTPFLFKQWGTFDQWGDRVGKGKSGRELAGATYDGFPA